MEIHPVIFKKNGKAREGKGFSREEVKKAGLSFKEARKLGIQMDSRRKTAHEENVKIVKTFLDSKKAAAKTKRKSKRQIVS